MCVAIAIIASIAARHFNYIEGVTWAIIIGTVVGNIVKTDNRFSHGIKFAEKTILTYAIALLGLRLNLCELGHMGIAVFTIVLPTMIVTILSGIIIGKIMKFPIHFGILLGVGNAVCGASAIAAAAPTMNAEEDEIGVSIGIVNLLGTVSIFVLPALVHILNFTDSQSAFVLGGVIQAVGQVIAAGYSVNTAVGDGATLIKMLRVLMIGPIVMILSLIANKQPGDKSKHSVKIPRYIICFIVCSLVGSFLPSEQHVLPYVNVFARMLLMTAMAGVGLRIKIKELIQFGPKAFFLGTIINLIQISFIIMLLLFFSAK